MEIKYCSVKSTVVGKLFQGDLFEIKDSVYMAISSLNECGFKECVDLKTGDLRRVAIDIEVIPVEGELLIIRRGIKENK